MWDAGQRGWQEFMSDMPGACSHVSIRCWVAAAHSVPNGLEPIQASHRQLQTARLGGLPRRPAPSAPPDSRKAFRLTVTACPLAPMIDVPTPTHTASGRGHQDPAHSPVKGVPCRGQLGRAQEPVAGVVGAGQVDKLAVVDGDIGVVLGGPPVCKAARRQCGFRFKKNSGKGTRG